MDSFTSNLIKRRKTILIVFGALVVLSFVLMQVVPVNYDLAKYLPEDSMTKRAVSIMTDEFSYPGMADVMVENVDISEALEIKGKIQAIDGVKSVLWLDDVTDVTVSLSMLEPSLLDSFYKENAALFKVQFIENDYGLKTGEALGKIRDVIGERVAISGFAEDSRHMRDIMDSEIFMVVLIVFPLCIIILMFASSSWIEPFIYLIVIGVSIVLNMGSNIVFNNISFITKSMAAVLQLAISMDYSLFLFHRYHEEREAGLDVIAAIKVAVKHSLSSITASALTTIAGFLALLFMQYKIGTDLGIVLAKGIVLSFLCVIVLMPVFIYMLNRLIDKTLHKPFMPSFQGLAKFVIKMRYLIIILAVLIIIPTFLAQKHNVFLYGDTSGSSSQGRNAEERQRIQERFGIYNPVILLVPNNDISSEAELAMELRSQRYIRDVQALVTLADHTIPRSLLPESVKEQFLSDRYSRMIVLINVDGERAETFSAIDGIKAAAQKYYPDQWLVAGKATSIADIKASVERDSKEVLLFSIFAVGIIILLTFKSLSIPVILVIVIQVSIWINMSIPYFEGSSLAYIGYLVVSSLQLGATIDYAILLSSRYMDFRRKEEPKQAAVLAVKTAGVSVIISALILTVAGLTEGMLSKIDAISAIGNLLGRGAALSAIMVLLLLPGILVLFDRIIMRSTLGASKQVMTNKQNKS